MKEVAIQNVVPSTGETAEVHSEEVIMAVRSAEAIVVDHSAEAIAEAHSAEATVVTPEEADAALEEAIATEDVVKMRTSAFIIRCTSFMVHDA